MGWEAAPWLEDDKVTRLEGGLDSRLERRRLSLLWIESELPMTCGCEQDPVD